MKYDDVVKLVGAIGAMRETHDHHGPRVAIMARSLALHAGLSDEHVDLVGVGGHLHDIGKIMVDRDMLNSKRSLTEDERRAVQEHTVYGWALVEQATYEPIICDIARSHHERWDGTGYPDRKRGIEIPVVARIVSICDVFEALTHDRSYRKAFPKDEAIKMMLNEKGRAFDPDLLDLFVSKVMLRKVMA